MSQDIPLREGEGAGLVLTRKVGDKIVIGANENASDAEILDAIRSGIYVTLVEVTPVRRAPKRHFSAPENFSNGTGREATPEELSMHLASRKDAMAGKGSARIGIKVDRAITIHREEILKKIAAGSN